MRVTTMCAVTMLAGLAFEASAAELPRDAPPKTEGRDHERPRKDEPREREVDEGRKPSKSQISTGLFAASVSTSGTDPLDEAAVRSPSARGGPGLCFDIWTRRSTTTTGKLASRNVGVMCSNGEKAASPFASLHETFLWYTAADAWVSGQAYFLNLKKDVDPQTYTLPLSGYKRKDAFDNSKGCTKADVSAPAGDSRYQVAGAGTVKIVIVRSAAARTFHGYWPGDKCEAISPAPDGWISLVPHSDAMSAKAWGTAY